VIVDGLDYDAVLSCGISDNIDFEQALLDRLAMSSGRRPPCWVFDGTVLNLPRPVDGVTFVHKNVGPAPLDTGRGTGLLVWAAPYENIFLKMDIETCEYRWLWTMGQRDLNRFKQIVIEFHFPFSIRPYRGLDIDVPVPAKMAVFRKLSETHRLVHLHANNCCGVTTCGGMTVPNVLECTYVRKDCASYCGLSDDPVPGPLDCANVARPEIELGGPPFTYPSQKRIVHRWIQKAPSFPNSYWGLGDMLRGVVGLYELCKRRGWRFEVDLSNHPVGEFVCGMPDAEESDNADFRVFHDLGECERLIETQGQHVVLATNLTLDVLESVSDDCRTFIRALMEPRAQSEVWRRLVKTLGSLPDSYTVCHFRLGDAELVKGRVVDHARELDVLRRVSAKGDLLITDSRSFKTQVSRELKDILTLDTDMCHLGVSHSRAAVADTLLEFLVATRSSRIKAYSVYGWTSGFVKIIEKVWGIPLTRVS